MRGTMMDFPLTLTALLERAGRLFPHVEILSRTPERSVVRTDYGRFYQRARRLGSALTKLGLQSGDRVASMMWNHSGHLDASSGFRAPAAFCIPSTFACTPTKSRQLRSTRAIVSC